MNKNIVQSNMRNAGSNLNWPQNYVQMNPTSYDVYSVYESEKHYLWCLEQSESLIQKLAVGLAFGACVLLVSFCVLVVF